MDAVDLEVDDPDACFDAVVAELGPAWVIDARWRAEAVHDGVTSRIGLTRPPEGPWTLAWTTETHVPEAWAFGAMGLSIAFATATMGAISLVWGASPYAMVASAAVLAGTLAVCKRVLQGRLPDDTAAREQLGRDALRAVEQIEGIRRVS